MPGPRQQMTLRLYPCGRKLWPTTSPSRLVPPAALTQCPLSTHCGHLLYRYSCVCLIDGTALSAAQTSISAEYKRMALTISSSFDAGNIRVANQDGDCVDLEIVKDHMSDFYQWFHFRLAGAA